MSGEVDGGGGAPLLTSPQLAALANIRTKLTCTICQEIFKEPVVTDCLHSFCRSCLTRAVLDDYVCPLCCVPLTPTSFRGNFTFAAIVGSFQALESVSGKVKRDAVAPQQPPVESATLDPSAHPAPPASAPPPSTQQIEEWANQRKISEDLHRANLAKLDALLAPQAPVTTTTTTITASKPPVKTLYTSGVRPVRAGMLKLLVKDLGNAVFINSQGLDNSKPPTHIVVSVENGFCKPTWKYYWGLSHGAWIVSDEWVEACAARREWIDETPYEVEIHTFSGSGRESDEGSDSQTKRSTAFRTNKSSGRPGLFADMVVGVGPYPLNPSLLSTFSKEQAIELLKLSGANVYELNGASDGGWDTASLKPGTDLILVGHPTNQTHSDGTCSFCFRMHERAAALDPKPLFVECAWVMESLNLAKRAVYHPL